MGKFVPSISILLISGSVLIFASCGKKIDATGKNQITENKITKTETIPSFVKYRSFHNPDSTWGYTVFVDSRPYINYSTIPYKNKGFKKKRDAEIVAGFFVKMIRKGEMSPKINKNIIDSLELEMKNMR